MALLHSLLFRLSQGSVAALIRWGGWNYTVTCHSFSNLTVKMVLKLADFLMKLQTKISWLLFMAQGVSQKPVLLSSLSWTTTTFLNYHQVTTSEVSACMQSPMIRNKTEQKRHKPRFVTGLTTNLHAINSWTDFPEQFYSQSFRKQMQKGGNYYEFYFIQ